MYLYEACKRLGLQCHFRAVIEVETEINDKPRTRLLAGKRLEYTFLEYQVEDDEKEEHLGAA